MSSTSKLGRVRAQRRALLKSLASSLVLDESIETTMPRAKAVARYTEKLVTKAKKGKDNLANRRMVISALATNEAAHKLVDELAPKLSSRPSGYFRIERTALRHGDRAQMARVSFIDDLKTSDKSPKKSAEPAQKKPAAKDAKDKPAANSKNTGTPVHQEAADSKIQPKTAPQAPKRSGVRGNR